MRQLHGVCDGDGPAWVKRCDFTLLMTHHPPDWLSSEAREHFFGEIVPPGRWARHLFGPMQEGMTPPLINGVSQIAPFDPAARQALLEADGLSARCELLIQLMQFFGRRGDDDDDPMTLQ